VTVRLRDYQIEAVEAVLADIDAGVTRPSVVCPTGSGKTIMFSSLAQRWQNERGGGKVVILAHRDELVRQAVDKYRSVDRTADVGVVKAERDEVDRPVVVASVQTLARENRRERLTGVSLVIADEAHHFVSPSNRLVLDHYRPAPAVGFTATMMRGDHARLGDVWEKISYQRPLLRMIREGYLMDVEGVQVEVPDLDLDGLSTSHGDFRDDELGERMSRSLAPQTVAKAYREHAENMPGVIFTPTVATAQDFAEAMREEGFTCEAVWGAMPLDERRETLQRYDSGAIQVLSNCAVLGEGWDSPRAQCAVMARPTKSHGLFVQQAGRVLRPFPGKGNALILDVVGVTNDHSLLAWSTLAGVEMKVKAGKTLLEAFDEWEAAEEKAGRELDLTYVGDVRSTVVDLFAGSRQAWLRTESGHWFISAGERFIVLRQNTAGAYDVAWFNARKSGGGWVARYVPDLGYAMAQGEGEITWEEEVVTAKDRAWRKRKMTEAQMKYARQLRIPVDQLDPKTRAGTLGDLISIKVASRRLDKALGRMS
jgi:superfamily II DNA or RNA helicase